MKKAITILLALLVLAAVSPLFAGGGGEKAQRVYRVADNQPDGYSTVLGGLALAEHVFKETNGAIKIEMYNNAVLGNERETIEMTQTGSIHFVRVGINPLSALNPIMNALAMPFLFRDRAHMFKVLDGPVGTEILESIQKQNLLGLMWFDAGFRSFYNAKREIKTPADMQGMKIRVQESALMMEMIRLLGASPTPMAYGEVYTSIQNGIVDGAENNWPSYVTSSHYEVAKFYTLDMHMASPEMILINTGVWSSLSDAEKKIMRDGSVIGAKVQREAWLKDEKKYEDQARAAGNTITVLTPDQHKLFADALMPLYSQPAYTPYADIAKRVRETK